MQVETWTETGSRSLFHTAFVPNILMRRVSHSSDFPGGSWGCFMKACRITIRNRGLSADRGNLSLVFSESLILFMMLIALCHRGRKTMTRLARVPTKASACRPPVFEPSLKACCISSTFTHWGYCDAFIQCRTPSSNLNFNGPMR